MIGKNNKYIGKEWNDVVISNSADVMLELPKWFRDCVNNGHATEVFGNEISCADCNRTEEIKEKK